VAVPSIKRSQTAAEMRRSRRKKCIESLRSIEEQSVSDGKRLRSFQALRALLDAQSPSHTDLELLQQHSIPKKRGVVSFLNERRAG
jgi:3-dehydroquinate dehydratase